MRVAVLLSGRVKKYKNFLKLLQKYASDNTNNQIDVFISANDTWCEFYDTLKKHFGNLLKDINIEPYVIHPDFKNNIYLTNQNITLKNWTHPTTTLYNMTFTSLSMLYNDQKSFNMAEKYAEHNNFQYDLYIRTRTDIVHNSFPFVDMFCNLDKNILYSANPFNKYTLCITDNIDGEYRDGRFYCYDDVRYNNKSVTGDIAFGNKDNMNIYCNAYNYYLEKNKQKNGNVYIIHECAVTVYLYDIGVNWEMFEFDYVYETNRNEMETNCNELDV
jgi:hypothetical protein